MTKKCPHCKKDMRSIDLFSHYGIRIIIDQCAICGGMWFDNAELYQIDSAESTRVDFEHLSQNSTLTQELICPNDGSLLEMFRDPQYPKTLTIEQCPTCLGTWLNRGEFHTFSEERQKIVAQHAPEVSQKDQEYQQILRDIMHNATDQKDMKRIQSLTDFLAGPKFDAVRKEEYVDELSRGMNLFSSRGKTFIRGMGMITRAVPLAYQPIAGFILLVALILEMTFRTFADQEKKNDLHVISK